MIAGGSSGEGAAMSWSPAGSRPDFLRAVNGPPWTIEYFRRTVECGRLGHAYLLTGPRGSGKGEFARGLAKALLCETGEPCGSCDSCLAFEGGNHSQVEIFSPENHQAAMDISAVRDLTVRDRLSRTGNQIWIIEEVELLAEASLNALLKTLEEPREGALLLLTAPSAGSILPTIVSRCQRVPLAGAPRAPASSLQRSELLEALDRATENGFFARSTPPDWLKEVFPGAETRKAGLADLIDHLIRLLEEAWPTWERAPDSRADPVHLLEVLVESRVDLDRHVHPDLILERVFDLLRSITPHVKG